jgi:hypothetical protein
VVQVIENAESGRIREEYGWYSCELTMRKNHRNGTKSNINKDASLGKSNLK